MPFFPDTFFWIYCFWKSIFSVNIPESRLHKIIHELVGRVYSLVPLAMADKRLPKQMPRKYCNMLLYYRVTIMI